MIKLKPDLQHGFSLGEGLAKSTAFRIQQVLLPHPQKTAVKITPRDELVLKNKFSSGEVNNISLCIINIKDFQLP